MKAKDLMVGDWVRFETREISYKVLKISSTGFEEVLLENYNQSFYCLVSEIQPIPLTAEILEKNGFKNPTLDDPELINYVFNASFEYKSPLPNVKVLRVNYYDGVEWDFYALLGERKSSDCGEQYEYVIIIKYVHQLQHALRLAGIDKEIEL